MIADYAVSGSGSAFYRGAEAYRPIQEDYTTSDVKAYNNTRYGTITRGKQKGVKFIIKVL